MVAISRVLRLTIPQLLDSAAFVHSFNSDTARAKGDVIPNALAGIGLKNQGKLRGVTQSAVVAITLTIWN